MQNQALKTEAKEILIQLLNTIHQLTIDEYTEKISLLGHASIGEHTRHIIELFQQFLSGYNSGVINYDDRKRDIRIQENIDFASDCIANIISGICIDNKKLLIIACCNDQETSIESTFVRELMYNMEHCIHHQAIIKIAFLYLGKSDLVENFGVAKSTINYRKQCAQ